MPVQNNSLWVVFLIIVFIFLAQNKAVPGVAGNQTSDNQIVQYIVNPVVSFTGQNMFVTSTALPDESVRIIKVNGDKKDLGIRSLNSGTINLQPDNMYRFYFFMNATVPSVLYYVDKQDHTAGVQDATVPVVGYGCEMDTALIYSSQDEYGRTQSATANSQVIAANQQKDISIRLAVHSSKCYGMPKSEKGNLICFAYNPTAFSNVYTSGNSLAAPSIIAAHSNSTGKTVNCFEFNVLQNTEVVILPVTLMAGSINPDTSHNITVLTKDVAFDLHKTTLAEIEGYTDEENNVIGMAVYRAGTIYIS